MRKFLRICVELGIAATAIITTAYILSLERIIVVQGHPVDIKVSYAQEKPIGAVIATSSKETASLFAGYSQLERISACESTGDVNGTPRQFNDDGSVLWGNDPVTGQPVKRDVGAVQVNLYVWGDTAKSMGLDVIHSKADNIAFGKYLYDTYGTLPWDASRGCWETKQKTVHNK